MEENKLLTGFKKHMWSCAMIAATLIVLSLTLERSFRSKKTTSTQDFLTVQRITERLTTGEPLSMQSVEMLERILARHPELHARYDTLLSLSFLHQENSDKALSHSLATLKRGEKSLSAAYVSYAQTSLLITEEKYVEAFSAAQKLETELQEDPSSRTLHAFNLVRLAFLSKKLHNSELQKEFAAKLEALQNYPEVAALFKDGTFTLKEYFS